MDSLLTRYTYGHSDWPASYSTDARFYSPQRNLLEGAKTQAQILKDGARMVAASNLAAADVICNEIYLQTAVIERAASEITESIQDATEEIVSAVDHVGNRICAYLGELDWQLTQMNATAVGILEVLRRSRSNEARQLVQQGVRHYTTGEYEEAEERFLRALDYDTTDHQVLMNLAFIEIHKGNSEKANKYFTKALKLPEELDPPARFRCLWETARLHYAEKHFAQAFETSLAALKARAPTAEELYTAGTYAALAGNTSEALKRIGDAIEADPVFFARAAVEKDLEPLRPAMLKLLSDLAERAKKSATEAATPVVDWYWPLVGDKRKFRECEPQIKEQAEGFGQLLTEHFRQPTYSGSREVVRRAPLLTQVADGTSKALELSREEAAVQERLKRLSTRRHDVKGRAAWGINDPGSVVAGMLGCGYLCGYLALIVWSVFVHDDLGIRAHWGDPSYFHLDWTGIIFVPLALVAGAIALVLLALYPLWLLLTLLKDGTINTFPGGTFAFNAALGGAFIVLLLFLFQVAADSAANRTAGDIREHEQRLLTLAEAMRAERQQISRAVATLESCDLRGRSGSVARSPS